jgi:two-component system sensor histidine kinase PilS (NtrC family)
VTPVWPNSTHTPAPEAPDQPREFERLWRGFMTARTTLGLVLALLQAGMLVLVPQQGAAPLAICTAYFAAALGVRLTARPQQLRQALDAQWLGTVGVDLLAFTALQLLQGGAINYTPLFALPVLMVSVLGSMLLALATAASVTLLLFLHAAWLATQPGGDFSGPAMQAALTGTWCFAISFIASQLATRLASMELRAQRNQLAATEQRQVNELVIQSLTDGVLVVDQHGQVRSANPAALRLLDAAAPLSRLNLSGRPGWLALMQLIEASFAGQAPPQLDLTLGAPDHNSRRLRVRTQLTRPGRSDAQGLCVLFMQDQREIQARIRAEKLAGMGRMSAAVAHEIRNPLAAITQANALLTEDLQDPAQQRLAQMVQQNALRLETIVKDVLHLAHAGGPESEEPAQPLELIQATERICRDWANQHGATRDLTLTLAREVQWVSFDAEHLRRVLINLLDNAQRYASRQPGCIRVSVDVSGAKPSEPAASLRVWSDGNALEPSVEQHLFEPFFSSESRSSGLGLYICRELCESHGASIGYERRAQNLDAAPVTGNEFNVLFKTASPPQPAPGHTD